MTASLFQVTRATGYLLTLGGIPIAVLAAIDTWDDTLFDHLIAILICAMGGAGIVGLGVGTLRWAGRFLPPAGDPFDTPGTTVLFIRDFDTELRPFRVDSPFHHLTAEEFLADEVNKQIGAMVALGSPADRVVPLGAARRYAHDTSWQDDLAAAAGRARCILAVPALSAGTKWEFTHLRKTGGHRRLFLLTPPDVDSDDRIWGPDRRPGARFAHAVAALHWGWFRRLPTIARHGLPEHPALDRYWPQLAALMTEAGYTPGADPGPGAVLAFEDDGTATILRPGATTAAHYLEAVTNRLSPDHPPPSTAAPSPASESSPA
ncbi:hypothetical protein [Paractinoplanes rishiriensis]|uniref:Uncharacterized protein n=1 Tax=Paractinoplanes rishiriensis TaxID=1050105 RepID=A0A919N048_9ACTN|nr:hypothetical protein [Actinoplanes rishiriensis]GIE94642.1 hypothetical protein Ari01nite_21070 [Actinoplanes rishiriensis]